MRANDTIFAVLVSGGFPIFLSGLGSAVKNHSIGAAIVSLLFLAAFGWWFQPGMVPLLAYAVVAALATLTVPIVYHGTGYRLQDELEWLENREAIEHQELLHRLKETRSELQSLGVEEGVRQADSLSGILDDYHSVVETRFIGKKNSPLAYLAAARRLQKHAVQNLTDVVVVKHSMSTINRNTFDGADEVRSKEQASMFEEQRNRVDQLLSENRKLFDALTDTAVEVANIKSFSRYERIDTLARLVSLAEIANNSGK